MFPVNILEKSLENNVGIIWGKINADSKKELHPTATCHPESQA